MALVVVAWEDQVAGIVVVALVRVRCLIVALVEVGMVIVVATAFAVATMVDVRVATAIVVAPVVAVSVDSVAQWVLDVVPVALAVLVALVGSAEKVVTDNDLQIVAGKQVVLMPFFDRQIMNYIFPIQDGRR